MHSATITENATPSGQTTPAAAPPTALTPSCSDVMPPARMQMIEKEIAKLEKPPMRRSSSCA
jgi:hypothetical protein